MSDIDDARADVKDDPEDANAHYNLGRALMVSIEGPLRAGNLNAKQKKVADEAERSYLKALEITDLHGRAHIMVGMLYRFTKRYDDAVPHLKRGMTLPPESKDWMIACDTLAACFMEQERYGDAVPILEQAIKAHATDPSGYWKLGASLYFLKRLPEAKAVLEAGLQACPGHAQLAASLAECLEAMGQAPPAPAIPPEYAEKQKQVEAWSKELQEECMKLFQGPGTQEEKMAKMQAMQAEFQTKVQKLYQS